VCRLAADAAIPQWASGTKARLLSVTRTAHELSIVCDDDWVPPNVGHIERGWQAFRIRGPIPFEEVGVIAGATEPLAAAGLTVFVISTFNTDYVLVQEARVEAASAALKAAGFEVG